MKFFNTLKHDLLEFKPKSTGKVNLYTCGPTVYDFAHIGNLRAFIFADIIKRALQFNGYDVNWVMNITDIDDKTISGAIKQFGQNAGVEALVKFTNQYFELFLEDLKEVNINRNDISFVKVTEKIADIQLFILKLMDLGFGYKAEDGSIYFSIEKYQEKFGDYGALVGEKFLEGKKVGARVKVDEYDKDNLSDFALWKAHSPEDANIFWDHPILGKGRPGWHIECTLINYFKFPEGTDIHTGGVDLIFPHHTNEIAQAIPVYRSQRVDKGHDAEKNFVEYWLHSEYITVENKKMSKSAHNFITLNELIKEQICNGYDLRYLYLQSHYRTKLNVTKESLNAAKNGLTKLKAAIGRLIKEVGYGQTSGQAKTDEQSNQNNQDQSHPDTQIIQQFTETLNNDLNTPQALAILQQTVETELPSKIKLATIYKMDEIFGLDLQSSKSVEYIDISDLDETMRNLIERRQEARKLKDYELSDELRLEIESRGYIVIDILPKKTDGGESIPEQTMQIIKK